MNFCLIPRDDEMEFQILLTDDKTKYKQIYEQIRQAILEKKLLAHAKLPPKRRLAEQLNVSILTVQNAYDRKIYGRRTLFVTYSQNENFISSKEKLYN